MKKREIRNIVRQVLSEGEVALREPGPVDHHYPRVEWDTISGELADKWCDMLVDSFEPDASNTKDGELSNAEAKEWWTEQVEQAGMDLENDLVQNIRRVALTLMQEIEQKLVNGEYA